MVKTRRKVQKILVAMATFAATLAGSVTAGVGPAHADTGSGQVTRVYMNLNGQASTSAQSQYGQLINSLRAAAGHNYRGNVAEAQAYSGGFIQLSLTVVGAGTSTMALWINPQDLYVVGFTSHAGVTYSFNDIDQATLTRLYAASQSTAIYPLSFGGNYNSLRQMAGRGREAMPISYSDVWNAAYGLAYPDTNYQAAIARSISLMIQYTSEAARFNDVFGVMSDVMHASSSYYSGLPIQQQYLENNWAALSRFGYDISRNPTTAPRAFDGIGTLFSWSDVARYLALMLASYTLPGRDGNWGTSQE